MHRVRSGSKLRPAQMVRKLLQITEGGRLDAVSIGYPSAVQRGWIVGEPGYLGEHGRKRLGNKKWRGKVNRLKPE